MNRNSTASDQQKKFARIITWATPAWGVAVIILVFYLGYLYFSNGLHDIVGDIPGWLGMVRLLMIFAILQGGYYIVERIRQINNSTSIKTYGIILLIMIVSVITLLVCVTIMHACIPKFQKSQSGMASAYSNNQANPIDTALYLSDTALYHYGTTGNAMGYAIVNDRISIKGKDANAYGAAKKHFREKIFDMADKLLMQSGNQKTGQVILPLFDGNARNQVILKELHRRRYFYYDENTHSANGDYFLSGTLCLAIDPSLDSTIQVIMRDICIPWALYKKILNGPIPDNGMEITLQQIVQAVCTECPKLVFVQLILSRCGGKLDCDSLYFESGRYELSEASRIIIQRFYEEFLNKYPDKYYIDLYGFTDNRPIKDTIEYYGNGTFTDSFSLLPNTAIRDTALRQITSNVQLSFARGYSCYEFLRRTFPRQPNVFRYTGGGEGNFGGGELHQRTVKIVINKK